MSFEQADGEFLSVLEGVTFRVEPGSMFGLMGPNGSGKTTLLRVLSGELIPTRGEVFLKGKDITHQPRHRRARFVGRVHQDSYKALASDLTVGEVLSLAERRQKRLCLRFSAPEAAFQELQLRSKAICDFLMSRRETVCWQLSGGQRQLLAIAVAVLGRPYLLLLDEHMSSLDEQYTDLVTSMITEYVQSTQAAVIVVTHSHKWAKAYCTELGEIRAKTVLLSPVRSRDKPPTDKDHDAYM
jgi:putative ABC transport system ATP-binding protein